MIPEGNLALYPRLKACQASTMNSSSDRCLITRQPLSLSTTYNPFSREALTAQIEICPTRCVSHWPESDLIRRLWRFTIALQQYFSPRRGRLVHCCQDSFAQRHVDHVRVNDPVQQPPTIFRRLAAGAAATLLLDVALALVPAAAFAASLSRIWLLLYDRRFLMASKK